MANGDDFDPRLYPDLFTDEELDPIQMAWLMSTMMDDNKEQPEQPQQDNPSNNQQTNLFAQPQNLFAQPQNPVVLDEEALMNNPALMQLLMSLPPEMLMDENNAGQIGQLLMNNIDNTNEQNNGMDINEINRRINEPMIVSMNQPVFRNEESQIDNNTENNTDNINHNTDINTDINTNNEMKIEVNTQASNTINEVKPEVTEEVKPEVTEEKEEPKNPHVKHKKTRCNLIECKAKLGLLGFSCRCGYQFCAKHRHTNDHFCTYDHKSHDKNQLKQKNEKVVADKVHNRI